MLVGSSLFQSIPIGIGGSQLDLSIANQMLLKHRAKLESAQKAMDEAKVKLEAEQETARETKAEVDELLSWADCYEAADISTKHVIVARLIESIDISFTSIPASRSHLLDVNDVLYRLSHATLYIFYDASATFSRTTTPRQSGGR